VLSRTYTAGGQSLKGGAARIKNAHKRKAESACRLLNDPLFLNNGRKSRIVISRELTDRRRSARIF